MILIFGAGGQLGQNLQVSAAQQEIPFAAFSRFEIDITDKTAIHQVLKEIKPKMVVNAAGYTKVDLAEKEIEAARLGNEIGPGIVASVCALQQTPLIHISTDYVFDGKKTGPYVESDPVSPLNAYGRTKAAGEAAVRNANPQHIILRTAWVYGEYGNNFLKTMLRLAKDRDELRVVADQHGCPTSTRDLAAAILRIAGQISSGANYGTYHFSGTGKTSWHGFASRIIKAQAEITERHPKVTAIYTAEYPSLAPRPANSVLDCGLFERTFGFRARGWEEEAVAISKLLAGKS